MADYTFENSIYGRNLTMSGDRQPTPAEVRGAYEKMYGGDLLFNKLENNKSYLTDLKADYKRREGNEFEGSSNELIEEEFEYWNMVDNNLVKGAYEAGMVFSDMSKEEKQRTMRRFDVYDRTNAFGEGSRDFFEQLKGVSSALITDPTNLLGGLGLWKLAGKTATKGLTKKALEKLLIPAVVGATYGTAADIERQTREISLEGREEIDPAQTATTAAVSSVLSLAGPAVVKGGAGFIDKAFKLITSPEARETVKDRAAKRVVDTLGGGATAKKEATTQLEEKLGSGDFSSGIFGAQTTLGKAVGKIRNNFIRKYSELGELGISTGELNGFAKALISDGVDIPNISTILQDVDKGLKSPSDALRLFRQYIGDARFNASQGKGRMADQTELMERWDLAITDLFDTAANRVGKGKESKLIDSEFSAWQTFRKDAATTLRGSKSDTKLASQVKAVIGDPSKSLGEYNKLMADITKISKFSGTPDLSSKMQGFVQQALKETFFENNGSKIIKFAKSTTGRETLKKLFPEHKDAMNDFGELLKRVEGHDTVKMFWGRMIPSMLAAGAGAGLGGPLGAAAATSASLISLEVALKSEVFRKMALKAYSSKNIDTKSVNGMIKWLDAKGFKGEQMRDQFLGVSTIGSGQLGQEVTPEGGVPLVEGAVNKIKSTIGY